MIALVLGVLALAIVAGLVTPRTADAFVGESTVINPAGPTLTEPAKSIITNPTFLESEPVEAGLAGEGDGLTATLIESGALPEFASVLPWVAGAAIGTAVVCEVFIGGCFEFFGSGSDPTKTGGITWNFTEKGGAGIGPAEATVLPGDYYTSSPNGFVGHFTKVCGDWTVPVPAEAAQVFDGLTGSCEPKKGEVVKNVRSTAVRSGEAGRDLRVTGKAKTTGASYYNSATNSVGSKPRSDWATRTAECLGAAYKSCGMTEIERDHLGEKVASEIGGSEVSDPFLRKVPDCAGLLWLPCKKELEELKLVPERSELGWETAVLTKPADAVVETKGAGSKVEPGTKVKVITNPPEEGMPLVIPQPETNETYPHYASRLNPSLEPERHDLEAPFIDPGLGPNAVVSTSPEPGTRLDPASKHAVRVSTNPADAPAPLGAWSPPPIPAIDMSPLSGFSPCGVFPFGLFCWVGEALGQFNTTGTCPGFSAPVAGTGSDFEVTLCGETAETIMGYLRPAILLAFTVGLGFLFARGTKAIGDD